MGDELRAAIDFARTLASGGVLGRREIERIGQGWVGEEAFAIAICCALTAGSGTRDDVCRRPVRSEEM